MIKVLVVEDERVVALHVQQQLSKLGYDVVAASCESALETTTAMCPDVVLMDIHLKGNLDGKEAAARTPGELEIASVFVTAYAEEAIVKGARASKPSGFLVKPYSDRELQATIQLALDRRRDDSALLASKRRLAQLNEKLQAQEEENRRLSVVATNTTNSVIISDSEGRIEWVNQAFTRVSGYSLAEARGHRAIDLLQGPASDPATIALVRERVSRGEGSRDLEMLNYTKAGEPYWVNVEVQPIRNADGTVAQFISIGTNIAARKAAEAELKASHDKFAGAFHGSTDAMGVVAIGAEAGSGEILDVNEAAERLFGLPRNEIVGRTLVELAGGIDRDQLADYARRLRSNDLVRDYPISLRRRDGTTIEALVTASQFVAAGKSYAIFIVRDVTEARTAERRILGLSGSLEARLRQLRAITDNLPALIVYLDAERRFRFMNRTAEQWLATSIKEIEGKTVEEAMPDDYVRSTREVRDRLTSGRAREEATIRYPDGRTRAVEAAYVPDIDGSGELQGYYVLVIDVTERKEAEHALRQSQELLLESQRLGKVGYILVDAASKRVYWSDSMFELRRAARREFLSYEEAIAFIHPDDRQRYFAVRDAAVAARRDFVIDVRIVRGDGSTGWEYSVGHPRLDADGALTGLLVVVRDVTESKEAEEAVRRSEARFRALIEHSADVIAVFQPDGTLTYRSPSLAYNILGYAEEDVIGTAVFDRVHPDDTPALAAALEQLGRTPDRRGGGRVRMRARDGSLRHIDWSGRNALGVPGVDGIIVNAHDVTEAVTLQEQLLQAQKMEAIGQLAGGIAHDFNNLLGAVLGFAGFLLQDLPEGSPQHGFARRIVTASERGREMVEQILAFARSGVVERKPTDLARVVRETRELLRASLPSSTTLEVLAVPEGLVAQVNAAQIGQILLNLCVNANQALQGKRGSISISLARVAPGAAETMVAGTEVGANRAIDGTFHADRSYARITVADSGVGMEEDVLRQIFNPFFTTKARGQGTGLGLAVVHGVVQAYDGACIVTSRPDAGSVFAIYLPLAADGAEPTAAAALPPEPRGRERVLIVDDDGDIRDVLSIGLDRLGYEVAALDDPEAAFAAFAEHPEAWDVVISDQTMPMMTGVSLLERLKALRPGLCFVLCSGDGASEAAARTAGAAAFFVKPVSPPEIARAIRQLIDAPAAAIDARSTA
jgi:PAS domain S-box-containing protein